MRQQELPTALYTIHQRTHADDSSRCASARVLATAILSFSPREENKDPCRNRFNTRPNAKNKTKTPSSSTRTKKKMLPTIHQGAHVDDSHEHPAARVTSDSYVIFFNKAHPFEPHSRQPDTKKTPENKINGKTSATTGVRSK